MNLESDGINTAGVQQVGKIRGISFYPSSMIALFSQILLNTTIPYHPFS